MYQHILIPTDGSPLSQKAAQAGVALAQALGARVTGLFAAPPATPVVYRHHLPVGYKDPAEHRKMIEAAAERYLDAIERQARKAKVECATVSVTSDFPADAILATAKKRGCDLIFMASHGRKGLAAALLGSETQKVLAQATVPVVVWR